MNFLEIFKILKKVLLNSYVIAVTIVVILYCSFMSYVAHYKKTPPKPKKRRIEPTPPPTPTASSDSNASAQPETSAEE